MLIATPTSLLVFIVNDEITTVWMVLEVDKDEKLLGDSRSTLFLGFRSGST